MSKKISTLFLVPATGAMGVAAFGAQAAPAHATTMTKAATDPWTINQPNSTNFTGVNETSAILEASGVSVVCPPTTATASGHVSGNGKSGVPVQLGTITKAHFGPCTVPLLGTSVSASLVSPPIGINASAHTTSSGVTKGWIGEGSVTPNPIKATIHGINGFVCTMSVSGARIPGSFHNASHVLSVNPGSNPTLHITHVTGCSNAFVSSEAAFFKAAYATTPQLSVNG